MTETASTLDKRLARFLRGGTGLGARRVLHWTYATAQLALGERMAAVGLDDGRLGSQIARLEAALRHPGTAGATRQALLAERERLLRELADAALADDAPLPGADAEFRRASAARAALRGAAGPAERARQPFAEGTGLRWFVFSSGAVGGAIVALAWALSWSL